MNGFLKRIGRYNYSLDRLWCWGLGRVGEDEVDEHGGESQDGAHHGEGESEAANLVQGAANDRTHDLAWRI